MSEPFIGGDPGASLWAGSLLSRLDAADQLLDRAAGKLPPLHFLRDNTPLSASSLLLALFALILLCVLPPLTEKWLRRSHFLAPNFRGERIPNRYGVLLLFFAVPTLFFARFLFPSVASDCENGLIITLGFGGLGWLDDARGDTAYRGLRGHFRALFTNRVLTTGLVKAVGGIGLAGWLALRLMPETPLEFLVNLLLIALSANAFNLLDLRPGRAAGIFALFASLWLLAVTLRPELGGMLPLLFVVIPAWRAWVPDSQGKVMLGDTGSNLLGASFGLTFASSALPMGIKAGIGVGLIALHIFAERYSLTKMIAGHPLLRWLDSGLGIRGE